MFTRRADRSRMRTYGAGTPPPNRNGASVIRSAIWGPSPYAGPPESSPVRFFRILGNFHKKTRPVTVAAQMSAMGSAR